MDTVPTSLIELIGIDKIDWQRGTRNVSRASSIAFWAGWFIRSPVCDRMQFCGCVAVVVAAPTAAAASATVVVVFYAWFSLQKRINQKILQNHKQKPKPKKQYGEKEREREKKKSSNQLLLTQ